MNRSTFISKARWYGVMGILGILAGGCGPEEPPPNEPPNEYPGEPLILKSLQAEELLETPRLTSPSAPEGSRFLTGWIPLRRRGRVVYLPKPEGATLEVVRLQGIPWSLELQLEEPVPAGAVVELQIPGQPPVARAVTGSTLRLELPAEEEPGTVLVRLRVAQQAGSPPLLIRAAGVRPARKGEIRWTEDGFCLQPPAAINLVRPVPARAILSGRLTVSGEGPLDLRLELTEESGRRQPLLPATTQAARRFGSRPSETFQIPLGDEARRVALRFLALGAGGEACWQGLRLVSRPLPAALSAPSLTTSKGWPSDPPRLVVVYVLDALRADSLGHLGGGEATPVLDGLAGQGMTFVDHRAVAPNTLPSSKALFTGRAYVQQGGWSLPPSGSPTLAEAFRKAGYRTGLFSANEYVSSAFGMGRGFDFEEEALHFGKGSAAPYNDSAKRVHRAALAWLRQQAGEGPVFLYLHTLHPHNPYDPPRELAERFTAGIPSQVDGSTRTLVDLQQGKRSATSADQRRLRALYQAGLAYNDRELGRFLAELGQQVPPEQTLLVITSDHGEELFEHGGVLHGYTLYREMLHIPLILWAPGRLPEERVEARTDTLDLHRSLLEVATASVEPSPGAVGPGAEQDVAASLWNGQKGLGRGKVVRFAAAASVAGGIFAAESENFSVIWAPRRGRHSGQGSGEARSREGEYLFDLRADPRERFNRAGFGGLEEAWLKARLRAWVAAGQDFLAAESAPKVDAETEQRLRALGYVD